MRELGITSEDPSREAYWVANGNRRHAARRHGCSVDAQAGCACEKKVAVTAGRAFEKSVKDSVDFFPGILKT